MSRFRRLVGSRWTRPPSLLLSHSTWAGKLAGTVSLQSLRQPILTKAVEDRSGLFLWATMMLDYLKGAQIQNIQLRRLQGFPTGLAKIYGHLLSEVADSLDQEEFSLRRTLLLLLVGASRPLSLGEISVLIALHCPSGFLDEKDLLLDPKGDSLRLCWPLAMVVDDSIQFIHMSVKAVLIRTPEEIGSAEKSASGLKSPYLTLRGSHTLLARKCLSKLSQNQYKVPSPIAQLIRRNMKVMDDNAESTQPNYEAICYNYAYYKWHVHLRALSAPMIQLLQQVEIFLVGYEFVTWSEVLFRLVNGDFSAVINVRGHQNCQHHRKRPRKTSIIDSWKTVPPSGHQLRGRIQLSTRSPNTRSAGGLMGTQVVKQSINPKSEAY